MQYAHKKWNLHGTEKNGSTFPLFGKMGQLRIKKGRVKKKTFHESFFVDLTSIIRIINYT